MKLAKGGCIFNRRYLIVKDGAITYYRDSPHSLNLINLAIHTSTGAKAKISARFCEFKQIPSNLFSKKSHPFLFEISFISPSRPGKRIFWILATISQSSCTTWLNALELEKEFDLSRENSAKKAQQNLEQQIVAELKKRALREEALKKLNENEKRKTKMKELLIEEQKRKVEVENERKRLQDELEKKKVEEIEREKREKYLKLLEFSWDYQFQKLWSQSLMNGLTFEQGLTFGIRIFKHVGGFLQKAVEVTKVIVNELTIPDEDKRILPFEETSSFQVYKYQNMQIKLTMKNSKSFDWENFAHEFRASNWISDISYILGKSSNNFPMRVPLSCIVDFRGFRALVSGMAPLEGDRTLMHGPKSDGVYLVDTNIYPYLSELSKKARVKQHNFEWNTKIGPCFVHLSAFIEFHRTLGYRELESYVQESLGSQNVENFSIEDHIYMQNLGFIFPVDNNGESNSIDFSKRLRPEFLTRYQKKLSSDGFINKVQGSSKDDQDIIVASQYLKTKHIEAFTKELDNLNYTVIESCTLKNAFHHFGVNLRYMGKVAEKSSLVHIKQMIYIEALARACKVLLFQNLAEFSIEYSNSQEGETRSRNKSFNFALYDNTSRDSSFTVHSPASTPGLRKRVLRKNAASIHFDDSDEMFKTLLPLNTTIYDGKVLERIAEFLNLVFGNSNEADVFWVSVLVPVAVKKFKILSGNLKKGDINLRALLYAICFNCSLFVHFTNEIELNSNPRPFERKSIQHISHKVKSFELNSVEYRVLAERSFEYHEKKKFSLALQACDLKLRISKVLNKENDLGSPQILNEIAEVLLETGDIESAIKKAKESLVQTHPFNACSIRPWCTLIKAYFKKNLQSEALNYFKAALFAIDFHYHNFHPLHSKIYSFLGDIYINLSDYSSATTLYTLALSSSLKVLGPNHIQTAQISLDLGKVSSLLENYEKAVEYYQKAFNVFEAFFGSEHVLTVSCGVTLSDSLEKVGKYSAAEKFVFQACLVFESFIKAKEVEDLRENFNDLLKKYYAGAIIGVKVSIKVNKVQELSFFCDKICSLAYLLEIYNDEIIKNCMKLELEFRISKLKGASKQLVVEKILRHPPQGSTLSVKDYVQEIHKVGSLSLYISEHIKSILRPPEAAVDLYKISSSTSTLYLISIL